MLVGLPPSGSSVQLDAEQIADNALRIIGSKVGSVRPQVDIPELVDLYFQGRLKLDELISDRWPLEEINDAVATAEQGQALRALIVF